MAVKPQYFNILVVDIEKFGARPNPVQSFLRDSLYGLMERVLDEAGIDRLGASRPVDRGDGMFLLLPGSVAKTDLVGPFVARLRIGLRAHAQTSNATAALRLRVVLHSGEVGWDGRGWVGEDLNTACRMVDHQPLRDALSAAEDAHLVLGISDAWHRAVLRHDYPELDTDSFRPVRFDAKEIHDETVWVRVPGYAVPPGLDGAPPVARPPLVPVGRAEETARPAPQHPASTPAACTAPDRTVRSTHMTAERSDDYERPIVYQSGGVAQQYVGTNDGVVAQSVNGGEGPAADPELLAHVTTLRRALREAHERHEVDEETFEGASHALDEATREAASGPSGRNRFVLALRSFRGLVEPVAALAAAAAAVITAVKGA
ncbi:hypothetical protein [Streptomyces sp. NPDC019539]|uniref:hypothetical protein n=1 Tax=Streptomyces sp. NPDC019539 TaxID=3365063 RepID=UPI00379310C8